jgi:hypothetical protein
MQVTAEWTSELPVEIRWKVARAGTATVTRAKGISLFTRPYPNE